MSWTKRQFVEQAYEEIGYASYVYDLEPEQLEAALRKLDAMMGTWNGKGVRLGYPIPSSPENSDLDEETGVPDYANEAIYLNLALRLARSVGKVPSPDLKTDAKMAFRVVQNHSTTPCEMQFPRGMPAGAGHRRFRYQRPFLLPPEDPLLAGEDGKIDLE